MPVYDTHPLYDHYLPDWQQCEDFTAGERAVKARGESYLPRLSGQQITENNDADYQAYKARTTFFNATARTVSSMGGLIFRKDPAMSVPAGMETFVNDVTHTGESLRKYAAMLVKHNIKFGRCGTLIDYPAMQENGPITLAQRDRLGLRPKWAFYPAKSILNWWTGQINNQNVLTRVTLASTRDVPDPADPFKRDTVEVILECALDENNRYYQQYWLRGDTGWQMDGEPIYPRKNGALLERIPFYFLNPVDGSFDPVKPPINDLVDMNRSHYRTAADYDHGLHYCGLPTPWATGVGDDEVSDGIGPNQMWSSRSADAKFGILEFTGQGLEPLSKALAEKEAKMAALGADMLVQGKLAAETEGAKLLDKQGQHSVISAIADNTSQTIEAMLQFTAEWIGVAGEVSYELNTDYLPTQISEGRMRELLTMVQAGRMSFETYFWNLKRGEVIPDDRTADQERELIENDPTMLDLEPDNADG